MIDQSGYGSGLGMTNEEGVHFPYSRGGVLNDLLGAFSRLGVVGVEGSVEDNLLRLLLSHVARA